MNDATSWQRPAESPLVLVVDDEPGIRELPRDALEPNGFAVRTAATGRRARASSRRRALSRPGTVSREARDSRPEGADFPAGPAGR